MRLIQKKSIQTRYEPEKLALEKINYINNGQYEARSRKQSVPIKLGPKKTWSRSNSMQVRVRQDKPSLYRSWY